MSGLREEIEKNKNKRCICLERGLGSVPDYPCGLETGSDDAGGGGRGGARDNGGQQLRMGKVRGGPRLREGVLLWGARGGQAGRF